MSICRGEAALAYSDAVSPFSVVDLSESDPRFN
jgi:hypothetical protein